MRVPRGSEQWTVSSCVCPHEQCRSPYQRGVEAEDHHAYRVIYLRMNSRDYLRNRQQGSVSKYGPSSSIASG